MHVQHEPDCRMRNSGNNCNACECPVIFDKADDPKRIKAYKYGTLAEAEDIYATQDAVLIAIADNKVPHNEAMFKLPEGRRLLLAKVAERAGVVSHQYVQDAQHQMDEATGPNIFKMPEVPPTTRGGISYAQAAENVQQFGQAGMKYEDLAKIGRLSPEMDPNWPDIRKVVLTPGRPGEVEASVERETDMFKRNADPKRGDTRTNEGVREVFNGQAWVEAHEHIACLHRQVDAMHRRAHNAETALHHATRRAERAEQLVREMTGIHVWHSRNDTEQNRGLEQTINKLQRLNESLSKELELAEQRRRDHARKLNHRLAIQRYALQEARAALAQCSVAFEFTRQYVGYEVLPALPGWSWFDADVKAQQAIQFADRALDQ